MGVKRRRGRRKREKQPRRSAELSRGEVGGDVGQAGEGNTTTAGHFWKQRDQRRVDRANASHAVRPEACERL